MAKRPQRTEEQQEYRNNLAHNVKNFRGYGDTGKELAKNLLSKEELSEEYLNSLGNDRKLGNGMAKKFVEAGECDTIAKNLDKFKGLDEKILVKLIEQGYWREVIDNLDKFEGLEYEDYNFLAKWLIGRGGRGEVYENESLKEVLMVFVAKKEPPVGMLAKNVDKFKGLDREVAVGLIDYGYSVDVMKNLDKFDGFKLDREMALRMFRNHCYDAVFDNLDKFDGFKLDKEFALEMVGYGKDLVGGIPLLFTETTKFRSENLDRFEGLDEEVANLLIERRGGDIVMNNLDKFKGMDYTKLLKKLLKGYYRLGGMAGELKCHSCYGNLIIDNLDKFDGLDHKWLVNELINKGDYFDKKSVVMHLDRFYGLNHEEIVSKLIEMGDWDLVVDNLEKFEGIKLDKKIADKLIKNRRGRYVADNLYKFEGLDKGIAEKLLEAGYGDTVVKHPEMFGLKREK